MQYGVRYAAAMIVIALCTSPSFSQDRQIAGQAQAGGGQAGEDLAAGQDIVPAIAAASPELEEAGQFAWRLLYTDGIGGLRELQLSGKVREVCDVPGQARCAGFTDALDRLVVLEQQYVGHDIGPNGEPDDVPSYRTLMHHLDESGAIDVTIPLAEFQRGIGDVSFSPTGHLALVTTNYVLCTTEQRADDDYDAFDVEDVYEIDTETGATKRLLQGRCRSLGEFHPQGDRFLFTDKQGMICQYNLEDKSITPFVEGRRGCWNAVGDAVRYIPSLSFTTVRGNTYSSRQTGDGEVEFEYNIETKLSRKLGPAGLAFYWSPDREYGVRIFHYDTLFPLRFGMARVMLESPDRKREALLIKDIKFPQHVLWKSQ